jgi:hypothetical protein
LRARLPRQRSNRRGSNGQLQKFPTLHDDLLTRMPQLRAIIRFRDDGVAVEECRVLCKNSNDDTAQRAWRDVFIADS